MSNEKINLFGNMNAFISDNKLYYSSQCIAVH